MFLKFLRNRVAPVALVLTLSLPLFPQRSSEQVQQLRDLLRDARTAIEQAKLDEAHSMLRESVVIARRIGSRA